jgi:hypothetical protein
VEASCSKEKLTYVCLWYLTHRHMHQCGLCTGITCATATPGALANDVFQPACAPPPFCAADCGSALRCIHCPACQLLGWLVYRPFWSATDPLRVAAAAGQPCAWGDHCSCQCTQQWPVSGL